MVVMLMRFVKIQWAHIPAPVKQDIQEMDKPAMVGEEKKILLLQKMPYQLSL